MRITFLGHAGLLVEAAGVTVLCDPWLSDAGAFQAGWFQYPCNHHLADGVLGRKIDYLYLSHEHGDHFDEVFLARLPKDLTVLTPAFLSMPWRERVKALGFAEVAFLRHFEERALAEGLTATIVHAPSAKVHDSALILSGTPGVMVNLNDCKASAEQLEEIAGRYGPPGAVFAQYSGASWFPIAYDLPLEDRVEAARRKSAHGLARWRGYMRALEPRWAIPAAGPPVMLDPATAHYRTGPDSIFPDPSDLLAWLETHDPALALRTQPMLPGDAIDLAADRFIPDAAMHAAFGWDRQEAYIADYARRMAGPIGRALEAFPEPDRPLFQDFAGYWAECFAAAPTFAAEVDAAVLFEIEGPGGGRWLVDFRDRSVRDVSADGRPREALAEYAFTFASRFIPGLVSGALRWEDFFLSFRFRAWRQSVGAFNEALMGFLRFGRPLELRVQETLLVNRPADSGETFLLETAAGALAVQRHCPHMGQELGPENYDPEAGLITCPRHGWSFRVPGGECLNARAKLKVETVREAQTAE